MRWLLTALVLFAGHADAGTFKARGGNTATDKTKPAAKTPAKTEPKKTEKVEKAEKVEKTEKADTTDAKKPAPVAKKAPAKKAAPPAKKKPTSQVATKGRPDDLTPNPKKKGDVSITEDDDEDVIIRDLDD